ncbi:MAG TPA: NUDIX hydrolase [Candidatus Desulfofervidus auxilii]|uniref:NUDIX hydrolase n=1 Tax=Desulfofervidus auxilii TaxID=1621989 RepID=A0A7C0Y3U5_DESA2|nr:NUDIX hydrolase [Candidatus Desulfofervidus auxilii]
MPPRVKIEVSAGGVIYRCEEGRPEVVLCRHIGFRQQIVWSLPKGWVEPGEKIVAAALREIREESGLEGEIVEKIEPIHYWFYHPLEKVRVKKTVHFFIVKAIGGDITQHDFEVEEVRWFSIEEAIKFCSYKGEKEILKKIKSRLIELCQKEKIN